MSERKQRQQSSARRQNRQSWIVPDRSLEESVIKFNNSYLRSNLPADDLAPPMYQEGLLTEEEYEHYKRLKAIYTITANKSEYLTSCLIKRREGYLRKFCEILNNITGAEHIAEYLDEQYMKITKEGVDSLGLPGSKWISLSAHDVLQKVDEPRSRCSKCKSLKHENKRLRKMQRWLEVQVEGLKRENQQLRQTNIFSQNLLQSSKKQLELMEEKGRELRNLIPMLQQASTLIECTSVARTGLSANFNHMEEFFQTFSNSLGQQESTDHLEQNSHSGYHHIRQMSTETQASSRFSSEVSEFEVEVEELSSLKEQTLKKIQELSACITATYPPVDSHHQSTGIRVPDHHKASGIGRHSDTNTYSQLSRPVPQFQIDDGYDHLSGIGQHKKSKDTKIENADSRPTQGSSPHIHKRFNVKKHKESKYDQSQGQSLKADERKRKLACAPVPGSQAYFVQGDELQSKLEKQRKKIESQS